MSLSMNKIRSGTLSNVPLSPPPIKFIGSSSLTSPPPYDNDHHQYSNNNSHHKKLQHLYVLPVLLLEFLALALTRAVIPTLLLQTFGDNVYVVMGCAECVRGLLAFVACPMFGKISDIVGRKACLFITVLGTCSPACSLAIISWRDHNNNIIMNNNDMTSSMTSNVWVDDVDQEVIRHRMMVFVFLLAISGIFSSTFTLTFAYISDTVKRKNDRVSAYGLALATFGLSFTIGPLAGGYLAHVEGDEIPAYAMADVDSEIEDSALEDMSYAFVHPLGQKRVFMTSLVLTILDLFYIYFILPESITRKNSSTAGLSPFSSPSRPVNPSVEDDFDENDSFVTCNTRISLTDRWNHIRQDVLPNSWSPFDTLKIFSGDPFMYEVGCIAFLYYTSLWAVVSTLMLYAVKRFKLTPERLGELMAALGLSTMISEAVLVRMIVPSIGEKKSMRLGLIAFFLQCIVLGIAYEGWQLFICVLLSMLGNLVYPSLTSLVSSAVAPEMVGEALGAINGVKALTEGVGPLVFGALMTLSEKSYLPGWPYLVASIFALIAYNRSVKLPDDEDEEYISEKYINNNRAKGFQTNVSSDVNHDSDSYILKFIAKFVPERDIDKRSALSEIQLQELRSEEDEYTGLLSEVDEVDEDNLIQTNSTPYEK